MNKIIQIEVYDNWFSRIDYNYFKYEISYEIRTVLVNDRNIIIPLLHDIGFA